MHGEWNTYEYYWQGSKASNEPFDGAQLKTVWTPNNEGKLSVSLWPAYAEQDANKTVNEGGVTQFRAFGYALADGTKISAEWEYALPSTENVGGEAIYNFQPVAGTNEFGGIEEVTTKTVSASIIVWSRRMLTAAMLMAEQVGDTSFCVMALAL